MSNQRDIFEDRSLLGHPNGEIPPDWGGVRDLFKEVKRQRLWANNLKSFRDGELQTKTDHTANRETVKDHRPGVGGQNTGYQGGQHQSSPALSDETHAAIAVKTQEKAQAAKSRKGRGRGNARMERDGGERVEEQEAEKPGGVEKDDREGERSAKTSKGEEKVKEKMSLAMT
ncbi:hypothetical protein GBF38_023269 [Nibea albiflora]|uniref:Uncharacterized protein n=1 Tax=Nibea albiflora TaxID=240163 RepID=A0ACB7EY15_NIBAL|nr:hypothetical protein GBF38_023269 [Nibea albiflora]